MHRSLGEGAMAGLVIEWLEAKLAMHVISSKKPSELRSPHAALDCGHDSA